MCIYIIILCFHYIYHYFIYPVKCSIFTSFSLHLIHFTLPSTYFTSLCTISLHYHSPLHYTTPHVRHNTHSDITWVKWKLTVQSDNISWGLSYNIYFHSIFNIIFHYFFSPWYILLQIYYCIAKPLTNIIYILQLCSIM